MPRPSVSESKVSTHIEKESSNGSNDGVKREEKFTFLSLCGIAISAGESWIALGNSLTLAVYNGGSPGVLFGFIADSICYWIVAASIAELASAMPHTATAYHWAGVTGGRYGRITSWFAGWWSFAAWQLGVASLVSFMALQVLGIYGVLHPGFDVTNWHIAVTYIACNWTMCLLVLFGDAWLAVAEAYGLLFTLGGWFVTIVVCASMPSTTNKTYASSVNVWSNWQNQTGWSSNGFVFCLGMLNAALAVCAPDIPCHLAEEIPNARRNLPLAIFGQYVSSFCTGFLYLVTLFYVSPDLKAITAERSVFPLAQLYLHATSPAAAAGLLSICLLNTFFGVAGVFAIAGRQGWALAREDAAPFSSFFGRLHPRTKAPFRAIAFVGVSSTALGCLYFATQAALDALTGSFVLFTSLAYLAAILPNLLSGRKHAPKGPFHMSRLTGAIVNSLACIYLLSFGIIFCFPNSLPITSASMNYSPVVVVGWTAVAAIWWFVKRPNIGHWPREKADWA